MPREDRRAEAPGAAHARDHRGLVALAVALVGCSKQPAPPPAPLGIATPDVIEQFKRTCPGTVEASLDHVACQLAPPLVGGHQYAMSYWQRDGRVAMLRLVGMRSDAELDATFARAIAPVLPPEHVGILQASMHTLPLNFAQDPSGLITARFPTLPDTTVMWSSLPYDDGSGVVLKTVTWYFPAGPSNAATP